MIPKNKIRLSKSLRRQINPYPEAGVWVKRSLFFLALFLLIGIYFIAKPETPNNNSSENNLAPKAILGEQEEQTEGYTFYTIKNGDTLFNVSQRHNVDWQEVAQLNNLEEPYIVRPGQEIRIPITEQ